MAFVILQTFDLAIKQVGTANLTYSIGGSPCDEVSTAVEVVPKPDTRFFEDFTDEADMDLPTDFFVFNGDAIIMGEALELTPIAGEPVAWAGIEGVPTPFNDIAKVSCTVSFSDLVEPGIGMHGGVIFCAANPTNRRHSTSVGALAEVRRNNGYFG